MQENKGITGILYNHLSLPRQIHFGQGAGYRHRAR
jgi:hypothetical protein